MSRALDRLTEDYCGRVAERIQSKRKAAGMSLNRLAEAAGMSQCMMSYLEQRRSVPTLATLCRIARALGTTVDDLVRPEDPQQTQVQASSQGAISASPCRRRRCR